MPNQDSGYFGMKWGDAIAAGAVHVSDALQRKYAMQSKRDDELRAKEEMKRREAVAMNMDYAKEGLTYDPNNPAASFETFASAIKTKKQKEQEGVDLQRQKTQAEIDRLKAQSTGGGVDAPPGYRAIPGGLEPIPGGPAAIKLDDIEAKKQEAINTQKMRNQEVLATVDGVINKVGIFTAGPVGSLLSNIGGTSAANMEGDIKTIQANLGFDRLSQMRAESPTGGALGQVSERELSLLTSAVANLGQKLSPAKLKENLEKVRTHLSNWQSAVDMANKGEPKPEGNGTIRVRNRATGKTGSMPAANFDESKYERI